MDPNTDGTLAFWKNNLSLEKTLKLDTADENKHGKTTWITDCVVVQGHNRIFTFTGGKFLKNYLM